MESVDAVIQEFGYQMGLPHLDASKSQVISFVFEKKGVVFFEKGHDEVLIYLARRIEYVDHDMCAKALKLAHYSNADFLIPMSASFKDQDKLVILTRVQSSDFTLQMIERVLGNLTDFFDKLKE